MKSRRRLPVNTCTGTRALSSLSEFDRIFIDMFVMRLSSLVPESLRISRIKSRLSLIVLASPSGSIGLLPCGVDEFAAVSVGDMPEVRLSGVGSGGGGGREGGGSEGRGGGT